MVLELQEFCFQQNFGIQAIIQSWSSGKSFLDAFVFLDDDYDVRFDDVAEVDWDFTNAIGHIDIRGHAVGNLLLT